MPPACVLDASALLATIRLEPGADIVDEHMPGATISSVNMSEVVAKLVDGGMPPQAAVRAASGVNIHVHPFDAQQALHAGMLRGVTRQYGLSLGDRACLALGAMLGVPVLTADRLWAKLDLSVEIQLIR